MNDWQALHPMGTVIGDPLPGAPELAARGSVTVGVRTMTLTMPDQADVGAGRTGGRYPRYDRKLQVEVWYPAVPAETDEHAVYTDFMGRADLGDLVPYAMDGRAFRDAAPDPSSGPCPVTVISHGYPGSRMLLANLAENLSGKGYVVLSIGHTDNTYEDFLPHGALESAVIHRSLDQRFVISALPRLNGAGFLKGLLQPENVGLIGYSMGGYGALRTLGARMSGKALKAFAPFAEELAEAPDFHGCPAVKAAVLFAPATFWLDPALSDDVRLPTLWFCGTADKAVGYEAVRRFCEKLRGSDRIFISYAGCGHNLANNPAPALARSASWEIYKRWADPVWDTWNLNNINCHFVTAFLDSVLRGEAEKERYLRPAVLRGADGVWSLDRNGQPTPAHTVWPGFTDTGAAGIMLERFRYDSGNGEFSGGNHSLGVKEWFPPDSAGSIVASPLHAEIARFG